MERVFGQDKTLSFDTEASNNTDSYQDVVETTNHNLQSEMTFRKIVDHFWRDGMFMTKAQYEDTIQGSLVISTPFAKLRHEEPFPYAKYFRGYITEAQRGERSSKDWVCNIKRQTNPKGSKLEINSRDKK